MTKLVDTDGQEFELISVYSLEQAIADGVLIEVFKNRWKALSGGKPIVATAPIVEHYSLAAIQELWNGFVLWTRLIKPTIPEEDQLFQTKVNGRRVWVMESGEAFTVLFPSDW